MIDIVQLAKARRADLAAEIAKIDDFIRMAGFLAKYSQRLSPAPVVEASDPAPATPTADGDLADILTVDNATAGEDATAQDGVALTTSTIAPAVTIEYDLTDAFSETAIARELARKQNTNLASIVPDNFAFEEKTAEDFAFEEKAVENSDELVLINPMSSAPGAVDAHIGQRLRQRRWMMGMSQQQLGKIVGVSFDQIQQFELGAARISVRSIWDIAAAMEVPVSYFFENLEGQAVDTGESRSDILTDEEVRELIEAVPSARSA